MTTVAVLALMTWLLSLLDDNCHWTVSAAAFFTLLSSCS